MPTSNDTAVEVIAAIALSWICLRTLGGQWFSSLLSPQLCDSVPPCTSPNQGGIIDCARLPTFFTFDF
jgi:hypothetical protein